MSAHASALATLREWTAPGPAQEALRAEYVAHLLAAPDALDRSCFPSHLTAGCLVLSEDGGQVMLNLHGKARQWFAFGGHLEPGDASLAAAARREATEESGLAGLVLDPTPVHLSLHGVDFCDPRGPVRHLDVRFLARVPAGTQPVMSEESLDIRWFDVRDLPTDEPDMVDLVSLAVRRTASGHSQGSSPSTAADAMPSR